MMNNIARMVDNPGTPLVANMRCEHLVEPLGIGNATPVLSWEIVSNERAVEQVSYRLQISNNRSFENLCWDSGEILSDTQSVIYSGKRLEIRTGYCWRVKVKISSGAVSHWGRPACFETGFFSVNDWNSGWAAYDFNLLYKEKLSVNHLRDEFEIDKNKTIKRARAYVAATTGALCNDTMRMNLYELRLNGRKVGKDLYNPGQISDRRGRALYRCYEIKDMLSPINAIGVIFASARISVQILVEYTDGLCSFVNLDSNWKRNAQGPFTRLWKHNVKEYGGKGEFYDARNEYEGWDMPGYDDGSWSTVRVCGPADILAAQVQSASVSHTFMPVSINCINDGKYVVDFGQEFTGHAAIVTQGPRDSKISMRFAEILNADGSANFRSTIGSSDASDTIHEDIYIKKSDAPESYEPRFSNHGFRYVEISGHAGVLTNNDVKGLAVHSDVFNEASFSCSEDLIQRLQNLFVWTFRSNMMSVVTDCPTRECNGWLGDCAHSTTTALCANFDMRNFYEKFFNDLSDCQNDSGYMPFVIPFPAMSPAHLDIIWSGQFLHIAMEVYRAYGEKSFLEKHYGMMKRYVEFLCRLNPDTSKIITGYGAWFDLFASDSRQTNGFYQTIYFSRFLSLFSAIASELGDDASAEIYNAKADIARAAVNSHFLKDGNHYADGTQSQNAHALHFGIVPDNCKAAVLASLVASIEKELCMTTGTLGTYCLVMALAENDRNDLVYTMLKSDMPHTWGYWLKEGATTAWEWWERTRYSEPHSMTFNHVVLPGPPAAWLYRELAGIKPLKPGYKAIEIKPFVPDGLEGVSATVCSAYGQVMSSWRRDPGGEFFLDAVIPAGTMADIHIPWNEGTVIYEGTLHADIAPRIKSIRQKGIYAVVQTGSGEFKFSTRILKS